MILKSSKNELHRSDVEISVVNCDIGRMEITCKKNSKESSKWAETLYLGSLDIVLLTHKISKLLLDYLSSFSFEQFEPQHSKKCAIFGRKMSQIRRANDLKLYMSIR